VIIPVFQLLHLDAKNIGELTDGGVDDVVLQIELERKSLFGFKRENKNTHLKNQYAHCSKITKGISFLSKTIVTRKVNFA